jgi:mono/diheme cytochrome c family protein
MHITRTLATTAVAVLTAAVVAAPSPLAAQQAQFTVNEDLAEVGRRLFQTKGCAACHAFGRKTGGPDLEGVTERREIDWLRRFIADPEGMVYSDSIAMALLEEWNNLVMRIPRLNPRDIDALIHYLVREDAGRSGM